MSRDGSFARVFGRRKKNKSGDGRAEESGPSIPTNISTDTVPAYELDASALGLKILQGGIDPIADIVAIHGLNGHREKTWTASNNILWLRDLLPTRMPNVRIMTWGYDSRTHSTEARNPISMQRLHDHADTLISDLVLERALTSSERRPIIFVVHSLGGLVLKSAHKRITGLSRCRLYGIIFAGTPHQGGEGVAWGKRLVSIVSIFRNTNTEMLQHLERDSEEVQRLLRDFGPISNEFVAKFAYETLQTRLPTGTYIQVVPKSSAVVPGAPNAEAIAISNDHTNLVKFASSEEDGYKKLSGHMILMLQRAPEEISSRWATNSRLGREFY
ncbi:hypothetical protein MMC18_007712 [Xylographa bjoerkii]|nr:hypothetical protein [Xylographa bjoerkii]